MQGIEGAAQRSSSRRMTVRFTGAAALAALLALTLATHAQNAPAPSPAPNARLTTLADLGYADGFSLTQPTGLATVFFPAPIDVRVTDPRIVLRLAGGSLSEQGAFLQLQVNGQTRTVLPLRGTEMAAGMEYVLPLSAADLREPFLRLGLLHRFDPRRERCLEEDSGTFLNVSAQSYFAYDVTADEPASLRGWLSVLPADVVVGVADETAATIKSAWVVAHELRRRGRGVRFVTSPEAAANAHIVVGEAGSPAFAGISDAVEGPPLRLESRAGGTVLLVRAGDDLALLEEGWRPLLTARTAVPARLEVNETRNQEAIGLVELGLDARPQDAAPSIEWHASIATQWLPPGRAPRSAHLDVIAAPALEGEPALLFSYLDGRPDPERSVDGRRSPASGRDRSHRPARR